MPLIEPGRSSSRPLRSGRNEAFSDFAAMDWIALAALLIGSSTIRIALLNGPLGSDDIVYLSRSVEIANGVWSSMNYNGALRYGFNIPAGIFIGILGISDISVNLWPLICSVAEVAVVFILARKLWGLRSAVFAALILASIPLHIAVAARIHADPVVAFFLTLSFILFYLAEAERSKALYFVTGLAMGAVFWVKELVVAALFAFAAYPLIWRRLDTRWLYLLGGGLLMLVAHLVLMQVIAGDPLHLFKVVTGQISRSFVDAGDGDDRVGYYFRYLFVDIKHTWLAPFLAAIALVTYAWKRFSGSATDGGIAYLCFWLLSLFFVLSFLPVSLSPLRFVMKQSNYLNLFVAPISLLAGVLAANAPRRLGNALLAATVIGGVLLGALEQQSYRVFTSNSKAAVMFAKAHPKSVVYGTVNNSNIATNQSIMDNDPDLTRRFRTFGDARHLNEARVPGDAKADEAFAILDQETMQWGSANEARVTVPPSCWKEMGPLVPTGFGIGRNVPGVMLDVLRWLPAKVGDRIARPLQVLVDPRPAVVYAIDPSDIWCEKAR